MSLPTDWKKREWLATNGAGAFASGTVGGVLSRRYHGVLVAALSPPLDRHVIVSSVNISVFRENRVLPLWSHQFIGSNVSHENSILKTFAVDPLPRWVYQLEQDTLEVSFSMVRGKNACVFRLEWSGKNPIQLQLQPLMAMRPFHYLCRERDLRASCSMRGDELSVRCDSYPTVYFSPVEEFLFQPDWWRSFEYAVERNRGMDCVEDLWTPGTLLLCLGKTPKYWSIALDEALLDSQAAWNEARSYQVSLDPKDAYSDTVRMLHVATDAFRADLTKQPSILAGYPWFEVWGRDSLISLPGLYLVTKRHKDAVNIVRQILVSMQDGLVPNRTPDIGQEPEFYSADSTLWLFEVGRLFKDHLDGALYGEFLRTELYPSLRNSFEQITRGTRLGIHLTKDGLFAAGLPGDSVTWMDARVNNHAITPRVGCPVELSALWAKACETLSMLAQMYGDLELSTRAAQQCTQTRIGFQRFWCEETQYCCDVISEEEKGWRDNAIRPNAVMALSVDPMCFTDAQARAVLTRAKNELVTPAGMRTLSPFDTNYKGVYRGGPLERDSAYHQGTVWPFLLGYFVRASVKIEGKSADNIAFLRSLVESAASNALAVGQVPEIADGNAPHHPNGCFAQAWSVAELLRALLWDLS